MGRSSSQKARIWQPFVARLRGIPGPAARVLAGPASRLTGAVTVGVLAVGLVAGVVRVMPLLLGPGVPLRVAPALGRGVTGVALETALFVAPPIGWALAAARLVERGEARALFAIGVRPLRLLASAWPAALAVAVISGLAALSWGREAAAPGRLARELLAEGRAACLAAPRPAAATLPFLDLAWVCLPGDVPRVASAAPSIDIGAPGRGAQALRGGLAPALAASALEVSDDLRAIEARDLTLVVPLSGAPDMWTSVGATSAEERAELGGALRLRVGTAHIAHIQGLAPLGRASNLSAAARALLLAASTVAMATLAAALVLRASIRSRALALALGAAGPAAALMAFSSFERATTPASAYAAIPLAGFAAMATLGWLTRRRGQR